MAVSAIVVIRRSVGILFPIGELEIVQFLLPHLFFTPPFIGAQGSVKLFNTPKHPHYMHAVGIFLCVMGSPVTPAPLQRVLY